MLASIALIAALVCALAAYPLWLLDLDHEGFGLHRYDQRFKRALIGVLIASLAFAGAALIATILSAR